MGGQRIDDHSFWAGKAQKGSVFPDGCAVKHFSDVSGAGELRDYQDTERAIADNQRRAEKKVKGHEQPDYRRW